MGFKLVRVDATEPCKVPLPVGTHLIGRGKFLDCNDHRVSRMHGQLKVTDDVVILTSLHQNPCFFRRKCSSTIQVLPHNKYIDLHNGDQFGLIPDCFWFELIYCIESVELQPGAVVTPFEKVIKHDTEGRPLAGGSGSYRDRSLMSNEARSEELRNSILESLAATITHGITVPNQGTTPSPNKRSHPGTPSDILKKQKTEPPSPNKATPGENNDHNSSENTQVLNNSDQNSSHDTDSSNNTVPKNESKQNTDNSSDQNEESPSNSTKEQKMESESPENVKAGPSQDHQGDQRPAAAGAGGDNAVGAAGVAPAPPIGNNGRPRERCMYGVRCYRVNPVHKAQFSHPGDVDWAAARPRVLVPRARPAQPPAPPRLHQQRGDNQRHDRPGIRVVQRHGNVFYINAHSVHFYNDYFHVEDSDGESVDYDYEF